MREVVLDTETTGLDPKDGHRIVEIGCVELMGHMPTGNVFHIYLNPERDMPTQAYAVHGLSEEFLADKPLFSDIANDFLNFLGKDPLVIHNARFDMKFINYELTRINVPRIPLAGVIDTLQIARQRYPGSPASLDALCRRFKIDNSNRTKHGALLDSELLAEVYLELCGGRQPSLGIKNEETDKRQTIESIVRDREYKAPRVFILSESEKSAHAELVEKLNDALWKRNLG
jgi:DNA polymerase-3 subunit epsilon